MIKKYLSLLVVILFSFSIGFAIDNTNLVFYSSADTFSSQNNLFGVTDSVGILGRGNQLDGVNDYINTGLTNLDLQGDISFNTWVKIPSYKNQNFIINSDHFVSPFTLSTRGFGLHTSTTGEVIWMVNTPSGQSLIKSQQLLPLNQWVMITTTWNSVTNTQEIYIDGNLVLHIVLSSSAIGSVGSNTEPLRIGTFRKSPQTYGNNNLDEISVYNKVLSQTDVTNLYQAGTPTQKSTDIVSGALYYNDFEYLKDETGLNTQLSALNGVTIGTPGKLLNGFTLDGVNDYLVTTGSASTSEYTISTWAKANTLTNGDMIWMEQDPGVTYRHSYAQILTGNLLSVAFYDLAQASYVNVVIPGFTLGVDHHVVLKTDNTGAYAFLDGVKYPILVGAYTPSVGSKPITIGAHATGVNNWDGTIDEFAIWERALTDLEISQLYNSGTGLNYAQLQNPIQMMVNTPSHLTNYTFDVTSVPVDITTAVPTNCSYTNDFDNATILFSTTGGTSHQATLTLPPAINQSQTFNVDFTCNNVVHTQNTILTLFKQRVPLNLDIIVPKANQIFNVDTGQIEFFLETNYQTDCSYQRDTELVRTNFASTGGAVHKTNFTTDLNVSTYNMNFLCIGNIINENVSRNITFFLDDLTHYSLTSATQDLPQVGQDIGDFMSNTAPGITNFILNISIIGLVISLIIILSTIIMRGLK